MQHARRELLRSPSGASVTNIALRFGLTHFGRFSLGPLRRISFRYLAAMPVRAGPEPEASSGYPLLERPVISAAASPHPARRRVGSRTRSLPRCVATVSSM